MPFRAMNTLWSRATSRWRRQSPENAEESTENAIETVNAEDKTSEKVERGSKGVLKLSQLAKTIGEILGEDSADGKGKGNDDKLENVESLSYTESGKRNKEDGISETNGVEGSSDEDIDVVHKLSPKKRNKRDSLLEIEELSEIFGKDSVDKKGKGDDDKLEDVENLSYTESGKRDKEHGDSETNGIEYSGDEDMDVVHKSSQRKRSKRDNLLELEELNRFLGAEDEESSEECLDLTTGDQFTGQAADSASSPRQESSPRMGTEDKSFRMSTRSQAAASRESAASSMLDSPSLRRSPRVKKSRKKAIVDPYDFGDISADEEEEGKLAVRTSPRLRKRNRSRKRNRPRKRWRPRYAVSPNKSNDDDSAEGEENESDWEGRFRSLSPEKDDEDETPQRRREREVRSQARRRRRYTTKPRRSPGDDAFDYEDGFIVPDEEVETLLQDETKGSQKLDDNSAKPETFGSWDYTKFLDKDFESLWRDHKAEKKEARRILRAQAGYLKEPPEEAFQSSQKRSVQKKYIFSFKKCARLYCRAIQKSVRNAERSTESHTKSEEEEEEISKYLYAIDKIEEVSLATEARNHIMDGRWQTRLLQALEHRPRMRVAKITTLEARGEEIEIPNHCEACHYRAHTPELAIRFSGPKTTPQKMWPMFWEENAGEDLLSENEYEDERFLVGRGCTFKAHYYHQALWIRDIIARRAKAGLRSGILKDAGWKLMKRITMVAKDGELQKKGYARSSQKRAGIYNVVADVEFDRYNPWPSDDEVGEGSVISISSSDESVPQGQEEVELVNTEFGNPELMVVDSKDEEDAVATQTHDKFLAL